MTHVRRGVLSVFVLLVPCLTWAAEPDQKRATSPVNHWAIVATDAECEALADLLSAKISSWPDVQLVERARIKSILNELALSAGGLVAPDRALRFGELSQANAQVLIEKLADSRPPLVRLRVVESRTGMRLLDVTMPSAGFKNDLDALARELKQVQAKLTIGVENRRLIGIAAIKSEEIGSALTANCRALTAMVEADLQRQKEFVVLERDQLRRLVAEQDLTGIEQQLRSSAWLVEVGVRRTEGNRGLAITGRIHSPGKGVQHQLQLEVPSQDWAKASSELARAIEQALGQKAIPLDAAELEAESAIFAKRRDWFSSAYRFDLACEMAEAALALAPTEENLAKVLPCYRSHAHMMDSPMKSDQALPPARRCQELRLEWWPKTQHGDRMRRVLRGGLAFEPHVRVPSQPESAEVRAVRAELDQLSHQLFDLLLEDSATPRERWLVLLNKLDNIEYLSPTSRDFAQNLPPLVEALHREIPLAKIKPELTDGQYAEFVRLLVMTVWRMDVPAQLPASLRSPQAPWKPDEVAAVWRQLAQHNDLAARVTGLYGLVRLRGEEGQRAAESLYAVVSKWPSITVRNFNVTDQLTHYALEGQRDPPEYERFVDALIARAMDERSPEPLLNYRSTIYFYFSSLTNDRKQAQFARLVAPLEFEPMPAALAFSAKSMRSELRQQMTSRGLLDNSQFLVSGGTGFWREYQTRPIRINRGTDRGQVLDIIIDRRPDAQAKGGEIVLVTSKPGPKLGVERVGLAGGTPKKIGPDVPGYPRAFTGAQLAFGDDATYLASEVKGFAILRGDQYEMIDEPQGAPATEVHSMAWCNGHLYVSYRDAFARFDPVKKSFELIASAISLEPRNKLDGRGSFWPVAILADEEHGYVYFSVQDNALPRARYGVWRYVTKTGELEQLDTRDCRVSWGDDGILLNAGHLWDKTGKGHPWAWIDTKTGKIGPLNGYDPHHPPIAAASSLSRFVRVGDHLISAQGQLYPPGGGTQTVKIEQPWNWLARVGRGFITHYDAKTSTLWYVERKPPEQIETAK